jgi:hypothetical protein
MSEIYCVGLTVGVGKPESTDIVKHMVLVLIFALKPVFLIFIELKLKYIAKIFVCSKTYET